MIKKQPDMDCHPSDAMEYIRDTLLQHISSFVSPDEEILKLYEFVEDYLFVTWG